MKIFKLNKDSLNLFIDFLFPVFVLYGGGCVL